MILKSRKISNAFISNKFWLLRHGKNWTIKFSVNPKPNGTHIKEEKAVLMVLGFLMNNKADCTHHINKVFTKTSQKSGWVFRTFSCRSKSLMKMMWKSLMQGHIGLIWVKEEGGRVFRGMTGLLCGIFLGQSSRGILREHLCQSKENPVLPDSFTWI